LAFYSILRGLQRLIKIYTTITDTYLSNDAILITVELILIAGAEVISILCHFNYAKKPKS
jgi:hypothetical protein